MYLNFQFIFTLVIMIGILLLLYLHEVSAQYGCGRTRFTGDSGTISSYTSNSSTSITRSEICTYRIKSSPSTFLMLEWRKFHVDDTMPWCYDESVIIKTG